MCWVNDMAWYEGEKMELTQEQIDALVAEKITEAKKGLFTQEDLEKKVVSEVDRRVETGIQKGLETQKQKWEKDYSERAKLTAEELANKDYTEKLAVVSQKESEIRKRANKIEAKELLAEAEIPKAQYESLMGMLISDDEATTKANVVNFITMFKSTKEEIETKVKSEYSKVPPPNIGNGDKTITKVDFDKMGYLQKMEFKAKSPDLYSQFMK